MSSTYKIKNNIDDPLWNTNNEVSTILHENPSVSKIELKRWNQSRGASQYKSVCQVAHAEKYYSHPADVMANYSWRKGQEQYEKWSFNNRTKSVGKVKAWNLNKALGNQTSFVTISRIISKKFHAEDPFGTNNICILGTKN